MGPMSNMLMQVYISKSCVGKESANTMKRIYEKQKSEHFAEQICLETEFVLCIPFFK